MESNPTAWGAADIFRTVEGQLQNSMDSAFPRGCVRLCRPCEDIDEENTFQPSVISGKPSNCFFAKQESRNDNGRTAWSYTSQCNTEEENRLHCIMAMFVVNGCPWALHVRNRPAWNGDMQCTFDSHAVYDQCYRIHVSSEVYAAQRTVGPWDTLGYTRR